MPNETGIKGLNKEYAALYSARSSFMPHYRELAEFVQPRSIRSLVTDHNKGDKAYQKIINSHASWAFKTARAGLLSGVMSPATEWFVMGVDDYGLSEKQSVRQYLYEVQGVLSRVFNSSNLYPQASRMLGHMIQFGTGALYHDNDFDNVARFYALPPGSYLLAQDGDYRVNTLFREWQMTTAQMMAKFPKENLTQAVRDAYDRGDYTAWFTVRHAIKPNNEYKRSSPFAKDFAFRSCYWQPEQKDHEKFLMETGRRRFPVYTPRWDVTAEDVYGTDCPGMTALGDVKGLQILERRQAQVIDKLSSPPLHGPASLRNVPINNLPAGTTLYDTDANEKGLRPIYEVRPDIQGLRGNIKEVEGRINRAYYVDLFLAISNMDGVQPRNQLELSQRNQERLLGLGPVLTHLFPEFLDLLIDNTYDRLVELDAEAGGGRVLPLPPQELQGKEIRPNYVSTLAVAQRAASLTNIERLVGFVGGLAQAGMTDARKINADEAVDEYADRLRVPPQLVRSEEDVAALRQQDQEAQQQAMQMEAAKQAADTAKTASETRTSDGKSVLDGVSEALAKQGAR